jgi:restriction endonuclease S subunit
VNIRDLKRASLPVPPRAEQGAIARFLEHETARIDSLVGKVRDAVTGKIDVREHAA